MQPRKSLETRTRLGRKKAGNKFVESNITNATSKNNVAKNTVASDYAVTRNNNTATSTAKAPVVDMDWRIVATPYDHEENDAEEEPMDHDGIDQDEPESVPGPSRFNPIEITPMLVDPPRVQDEDDDDVLEEVPPLVQEDEDDEDEVIDDSIALRFIDGQRKGSKILMINNHYRYNPSHISKKKDEQRWACINNKLKDGTACQASVYLTRDTTTYVRAHETHNHEFDRNRAQAKLIYDEQVKLYAPCPNITTKQVAQFAATKAKEAGPGVFESLPAKEAMKTALMRERGKKLKSPLNPKDFKEIMNMFNDPELEEQLKHFVTDQDGNEFLVYKQFTNEAESKCMLIFMSPWGRNHLKTGTVLMIDGTFKTSPDPFAQIYVGMAHNGESYQALPCFYALLPDKNQTTYARMFEFINDKLDDLNDTENDCTIKTVMSDYEASVICAVREVWPDLNRCGCSFHFRLVLSFLPYILYIYAPVLV